MYCRFEVVSKKKKVAIMSSSIILFIIGFEVSIKLVHQDYSNIQFQLIIWPLEMILETFLSFMVSFYNKISIFGF